MSQDFKKLAQIPDTDMIKAGLEAGGQGMDDDEAVGRLVAGYTAMWEASNSPIAKHCAGKPVGYLNEHALAEFQSGDGVGITLHSAADKHMGTNVPVYLEQPQQPSLNFDSSTSQNALALMTKALSAFVSAYHEDLDGETGQQVLNDAFELAKEALTMATPLTEAVA